MSRWHSREESPDSRIPSATPTTQIDGRHPDQGEELARGWGADENNRRTPELNVAPDAREPRRPYRDRGRTYMLRASEIQTLTDIGRFRAVTAKDLEEFRYGGNTRQMEADLGNVRKQHLILERVIPQHDAQPRELLALTKQGRRILSTTKSVPKDQAIYHGFKKPREANHDADLYKLYQRGLEKVHREGAKNVRVILDSELKRILYRDLARATEQGSGDGRSSVAQRHGLRVVRDTIPVPDLRLEYEAADGQLARLDLELATEHYRFRNIARKVLAGFAIYARNLRRILDQHDITAEILNL